MTVTLPTLLAIALGGAFGAVARFTVANYFNQTLQVHHTVYIGTMLVNIIGSFMMGLVYVYIVERELFHPHWKSMTMLCSRSLMGLKSAIMTHGVLALWT